MTTPEICLAIYLFIGFLLVCGLEDETDRKLIISQPLAAAVVAIAWPAVVIMLIPRVKNLKFRGKIYWERKS